jgi:hypothetical protein
VLPSCAHAFVAIRRRLLLRHLVRAVR